MKYLLAMRGTDVMSAETVLAAFNAETPFLWGMGDGSHEVTRSKVRGETVVLEYGNDSTIVEVPLDGDAYIVKG